MQAIEVGWRLDSDHRGPRLPHRGRAAALRWGFDDLGLDEIISIFEPGNASSERVMDRLGSGAGSATVHPAGGLTQ